MLPLYLLFLLAPCFCPVALPFSRVPPITLSLPDTGRNRRQVQERETPSALYRTALNQQKEQSQLNLQQSQSHIHHRGRCSIALDYNVVHLHEPFYLSWEIFPQCLYYKVNYDRNMKLEVNCCIQYWIGYTYLSNEYICI